MKDGRRLAAHYCRGVALHWRPVGPLPAATYWRRRGVVVLTALVLLVGGVLLLGGASGDDTLEPSPGRSPQASATATPSPTPSATTAQVEECPDDVLEVQARTDAADYAVGAGATLTLSVRNTGDAPCRRALGQGAVELVITSGEDRIWSSDDCAPGGGADEVVLQPGATQTARANWPGTRSAQGCPPDQPQARAGTYRLHGRVGDLTVPGMAFRLQEG